MKKLLNKKIKAWQVIATGTIMAFVGILLHFYGSPTKISEGGMVFVIGGIFTILMPIFQYLGERQNIENK